MWLERYIMIGMTWVMVIAALFVFGLGEIAVGRYEAGPMLPPLAAFVAIGYIWVHSGEFRASLLIAVAAIVWMVNERGFYWEIIDRYSELNGEGFLTANRVSAHIAFALALAGPWLWQRYVTGHSPDDGPD
jgi:hypothetical protein